MIECDFRMMDVKTLRSNVEKRRSQSSSGSDHQEFGSGVTAQPIAVYDGHGRVPTSSHIELSVRSAPVPNQISERASWDPWYSTTDFLICTLLRVACLINKSG